jgi:transposase InsO family protein
MVDEEIGMPAKRELSMRQLRHLLRLRHDWVSAREIGRRLGVANCVDNQTRRRARTAANENGARTLYSRRYGITPCLAKANERPGKPTDDGRRLLVVDTWWVIVKYGRCTIGC